MQQRKVIVLAGIWIVVCALATQGIAAGKGDPHVPLASKAVTQKILQRWGETLEKVKRDLAQGKAERAYRNVEELLQEMKDRTYSGSEVNRLLASVLVYRAIAAVDLGNDEEGRWYWHVAFQLYPPLAEYDFSSLGESAAYLIACTALRQDSEDEAEEGEERRLFTKDDEIEPPRKKYAPPPAFPEAKSGLVDKLAIVVQVMIDETGRPSRPKLVESKGEPTLVLSVFDALRLWEFEPAKHEGRPIRVLYNLTVNFAPYVEPPEQPGYSPLIGDLEQSPPG